VTIANLIGRGPVLLVAAVVLDRARVVPANPDPAAVIALLTIAFGSSASGNLLLMAAVRRVSAGRTSGALLLTPVASAAIAAIVLGERLSPVGLVGAVCILVGMALASGLLTRPSRTTSPR
jgi:drug/metabolite transporter (DMT)-like permease